MLKKVLDKLRSQKLMSMISSVTSAAMGILTFALLARALEKADFGVFGFYLSAHTMAEMLRNGLVGKPLIKFFAESNDEETHKDIVGSSWQIGFWSSLIIGLLLTLGFGIAYIIKPSQEMLVYTVFFMPILIISLPHNMATWVLNAELRFDRMIWIKTSLQIVYILGVWIAFKLEYGLWFVFGVFAMANLIPSLISILLGWDGIRFFFKKSVAMRNDLLAFGRYTMGTLLGGTLLRSSDVFLIRFFIGSEAVALYQVPQRLVNLIDIPLRALVSFSFPALAKEKAKGNKKAFETEFEKSGGFAFLFLLPLAIAGFVFAEQLVVLLGGEEYREAKIIMQVFSIYMAITSIDRYTGVALDLLNKPRVNMVKVAIMLMINIIGDIIALSLSDDVSWVAFVSIFTFSGGIVFGVFYLRKSLPFKPLNWLKLGFKESIRIVNNLVGN